MNVNVCLSSEMLAILSSAKNTCNRHCAQVAVGLDILSNLLNKERNSKTLPLKFQHI